jgi:3-oxoacyl-[acyl-carrier-protein] synthase I
MNPAGSLNLSRPVPSGSGAVNLLNSTAVDPLYINAYTAVTALGAGREAMRHGLIAMRSRLTAADFEAGPPTGYIGRVPGLEDLRVPEALVEYDCRNNRLAWQALQVDDFLLFVQQAIERHGLDRVGVVVGTSTSGILSTELAYRMRDATTGALPKQLNLAATHNFGSLAEFVRAATGVCGPALTISTACSSSAKAFATAARWMQAGLLDAVIVGGVDSHCGTTLHGFGALQLVAKTPCRPFDVDRNGISLGEGAAFALMERRPIGNPKRLALLGYGESADAHHMSAPHPEGLGAELAMRGALRAAGLDAVQIDYVNAHGTATRNNDSVEAAAIARVLGAKKPITSGKGFFGHTLGAAGAISAVVSLLSIEFGFIPGTVNTVTIDPECGEAVCLASTRRDVRTVLANAFGFGGSNAAIALGALH